MDKAQHKERMYEDGIPRNVTTGKGGLRADHGHDGGSTSERIWNL